MQTNMTYYVEPIKNFYRQPIEKQYFKTDNQDSPKFPPNEIISQWLVHNNNKNEKNIYMYNNNRKNRIRT